MLHVCFSLIWGPGDGRSVKDLKVNVRQLLDEFIVSYDFAEAERCVRELEAPNFMHEVVKSAIILVMEHPENFGRVSDLLQYLHSVQVISDKQLLKGFIRVNQRLSDIVLDSPRAEEIFNDFVNHAKTNGCLNQDTDFSAESSQPKALDSEIDQTAE